ncbi:MAG: glycosyltransferase [Vicinamibacterales bacterium]
MRIALVVTGGVDRSGRDRVIPSLLWLVERIARRHAVSVFVLRYLDAPATYPLLGATVHDLGRPEGARRQRAALARALAAHGPFDVIHAYWAQPAGRVVAPLARRLGIPSIVTLDSGEFASVPQAGYGLQRTARGRWAVRLASRWATRVTVCSAFQAALARQHGLEPVVIPLGVDTGLFVERSAQPVDTPYRLLHVASLNPVKDQRTLLTAFAQLRTRGLDAHLDVVGEDTLGGTLETLAAGLGVRDHVTFHGFLPSEALVALHHAAHLFVLSSLHEAAGVVLLEAAACGVPIVGTAVGYVADWTPDAAVAVPPGDAGALAAAIEALLRDPGRRQRLAGAAAAWARAHDANATAARFEALYESLDRHHSAARLRDWLMLMRR